VSLSQLGENYTNWAVWQYGIARVAVVQEVVKPEIDGVHEQGLGAVDDCQKSIFLAYILIEKTEAVTESKGARECHGTGKRLLGYWVEFTVLS